MLLKRENEHPWLRVTDHARTELGFQDPGTGWIPPSPLVQFKLYQGEVLPYNPGTRDWVESTQSETPQAPTQSVRGFRIHLFLSNNLLGFSTLRPTRPHLSS